MFESFVNAYDMSFLVVIYEQGYLSGILRICILVSVLTLLISVTRKLIALYKGVEKFNYKELLIRTGVVVMIIALYPYLYFGPIRFNDRILLDVSHNIQQDKSFWQSITGKISGALVSSTEEYQKKKTAIFDDDFIERGLEKGEDEGEKENKPAYKKVLDVIMSFLGSRRSSLVSNLTIDYLITGMVVFLAYVLIYFFSIVRTILFSIYLFLGPFVVVLYIEESTSDYFKGFIMSFINVLFWPWIQLIILLVIDLAIVSMNYRSGSETIIVCATHLALLYMLYKSTSFIPDLRRGRAGSDSGMVISSVINTGLRAASLGAKSAISTAFPAAAPFLGPEGVGKVVGKAVGKMMNGRRR